MIDNFSILLVLKGREQYTVRLMSYFNQIRFPYPIIIADGYRIEETVGRSKKMAKHKI